MTFDYAKTAATARRLIEKFGSAGQIKTSVAGSYDPTTGTTPLTVTTTSITAVVFAYPSHLVNGTTVLQTDEQAFYAAPAGAPMPKSGDVLIWAGKDYTVVTAKELAPAGVQVLMELQVRK